MKILFFILIFLTHQFSFAKLTEIEKNIKQNISYVINLTYYRDKDFKYKILNCKTKDYPELMELARISSKYTDIELSWESLPINHEKYEFDYTAEKVGQLNWYLNKISSSPDINLSKKFLNDIQLLVDSYNNAIEKDFPNIPTVKLPESFTDRGKTKNNSLIKRLRPNHISSSKYTIAEKCIQKAIAAKMSLSLHHECAYQYLQDQILNAKTEEYPALMQSAQFFAQTLKWRIYIEDKKYRPKYIQHIEKIDTSLEHIANSEGINLSNKFKKDIRLLIDAYNQSINTDIHEISAVKLPESFIGTVETKKHSSLKEWLNKFRIPSSQKPKLMQPN